MKRALVLTIYAFAALICISLSGCKVDDITKPVITILGSENDVVVYKSAENYIDLGATAIDDVDGDIDVTVSGTVNMSSAGSYTLVYEATDDAGNTATASRTVIVDAAPYIIGSYTVEDFRGAVPNGTYTETVAVVSGNYNKISFTTFANMANAGVFATIAGSTITVTEQDVICGSPSANRTFSGAGVFTDTSININYTFVTSGVPVVGHGDYQLN
jgi:hypothetical protein